METSKSKPPIQNPTSMRVLTRPPPSPPPPPQPPTSTSPHPTGVVVIGFIACRYSDVSTLINRIIDTDVFGSRRRDTVFSVTFSNQEEADGVQGWFNRRRISYYYDEDKGIVFLQLSSLNCSGLGPGSEFELQEFGDLQAMLFMFTVCHVVVYIQEGSRFDPQILRILRILQSAKHALSPFLRSRSILPSHSRPSSSSSRQTQGISSKTPSPRRDSSMSNRNNSPVSVMSGLGLYPALFPGQCTPVTLFAFIDDFSEMVNSSAAEGESNDVPSSSHSGLHGLVRSNQSLKSSNSAVVLSRSTNKTESNLSKKLLSSLESQIRFLIKKCRPLTTPENSSHTGSRGGSISGSAPLLTLDASRAVVLLDRSGIRSGSSLDYATGLVDDIVSGKLTSDSLLLESHGQSGMKEDILTLKECVIRQADILRGKGGLATNTKSGSAAGVGMVAAAAAAASASAVAASGRPSTVPELPSLEMWLSSSHLILKGILLGKPGSFNEKDAMRRKFRQRNGVLPPVEGTAARAVDSPDIAASLLESGNGINRKFSSLWCQRALPAAKEIYLKNLPPCYPTSQHEAQLEKALLAFLSMVKGPSVQEFVEKLQEECLLIWQSGRRLCDAVSLTGKPCMHQRHDFGNDGLTPESMSKEHNSGFVFLHACACGRSRKLRADPFDFETANMKFNTFPECDHLLPLLQLPKLNGDLPIQPFPWRVVRLGGARYYEPSKGLLQAGFSPREKFLLRWTIVLESDNPPSVSFANALRQGSANSKVESKIVSSDTEDAKKSSKALAQSGEVQSGVEDHGRTVKVSLNKISFGRGLPNIAMRKAFSEVVAGSTSSNSAFPPLQPKQLLSGAAKGSKKNIAKVTSNVQINISSGDFQISGESQETSPAGAENSKATTNNSNVDNSLLLPTAGNLISRNVDDASNALEVNVVDSGKTRFSPTCRHFVVYVGFEHECPRGHRFILSPESLNQLRQPDYSPVDSLISNPAELGNRKHRGPVTLGKSDGKTKVHRLSNSNAVNTEKVSSLEWPTDGMTTVDHGVNGLSHLFNSLEQSTLESSNSATDLQHNPHSLNLDDNGPAFSLLNRNIPIYLKCPHCSVSKNRDTQNMKFAGTISQLQRIFVVTPPFPIVIAVNPVVHFEGSHQASDVTNHEQPLRFSLGCQVILPPESFISIRLPSVYGTEVKDKGLSPLQLFEQEPELTAWIMQGTALQVIYKGGSTD